LKVYDEQTLTKEECKEKLRAVPLGRFVKPIDVAEMTLFLVSEKANNITGQNFIRLLSKLQSRASACALASARLIFLNFNRERAGTGKGTGRGTGLQFRKMSITCHQF
jgi:hypothetical protein